MPPHGEIPAVAAQFRGAAATAPTEQIVSPLFCQLHFGRAFWAVALVIAVAGAISLREA